MGHQEALTSRLSRPASDASKRWTLAQLTSHRRGVLCAASDRELYPGQQVSGASGSSSAVWLPDGGARIGVCTRTVG